MLDGGKRTELLLTIEQNTYLLELIKRELGFGMKKQEGIFCFFFTEVGRGITQNITVDMWKETR